MIARHELPSFALSVRQPWAWAIIHAGKNIENRSTAAVQHLSRAVKSIAIQASKGMTRDEYNDGRSFMASLGIACPPPDELARGGIIGAVDVEAIVKDAISPWWFGPRGLVLRNPRACAFIPCVGALGYFRWREADPSIVPPPANWMLPEAPGRLQSPLRSASSAQIDLEGLLRQEALHG